MRPGYEKFLDELSDGGMKGLEGWVRNDSLICAQNGEIWWGDTDTNSWTSIHSGLDTGSQTDFHEYLGDMYLGNAIDAFTRIEHTSYTVSTPAGAPLGNSLHVWAEKMWVSGQIANPRTLFFSRTASAANPEYIYDFSGAGSGSELLGKRGSIVGQDATKNALIIFKDNEIYYIRTFNSTTLAPERKLLSGATGCVGKKAFASVNDEIYFFNGKDIRYIAEFEGYPNLFTTAISDSIRRLISEDLDEDQSDATMGYDEKANLLKLWVKTTGATNNNLCLVYHFDKKNKTWTVDNGKAAGQTTTFKKKLYWTSATLGQAWLDEIGTTDDIGFIDSFRWTPKRKMFSAQARKKFRRLCLAGSYTLDTEIKVEIWVDGYLHKTITIDSDDVIGGVDAGLGQIGVPAIGTTPVAGVNDQIRNFEKIIKINKIGRYVELFVNCQTLGGYYQITDEIFWYLPLPRAASRNF